jgi:hypothetical protein
VRLGCGQPTSTTLLEAMVLRLLFVEWLQKGQSVGLVRQALRVEAWSKPNKQVHVRRVFAIVAQGEEYMTR